eukprot:GHVN01022621.1.p1 GENE.GHVN01022621.1~~GHVN01022621.1.p1  ORF type:complete len:260 (-),score=64.39 GHVN01022621.1:273-938(-)
MLAHPGGPHFSPPTMLAHPGGPHCSTLAHPDEFKNPSSFLKIYGDPLCMMTNQGASFTSSITPTLPTSSITPTSLTSSITPTSLTSPIPPFSPTLSTTPTSLNSILTAAPAASTIGLSALSEHSPSVVTDDLHLLNPIKGKNGNWACLRCSNINFPRRFRCNKCSERRNDEGDEIVREYAMTVYSQFWKLYQQNKMPVMGGVSATASQTGRDFREVEKAQW